ncbi:hypothetical protein P280DRAFT_330136 [Massarina eburnea CBS 473.64]|uniref:Uncharacterized protein n=1 Tax=Massarina eburnea CBS 473.64 TaxID=1395130 RepID=A0A6A6S3X4_9PLEO|nr:hypothetical protein P280DRAFT_330136 [Massarina eburnea CBS 473.64]
MLLRSPCLVGSGPSTQAQTAGFSPSRVRVHIQAIATLQACRYVGTYSQSSLDSPFAVTPRSAALDKLPDCANGERRCELHSDN